MKIVYFLFIIFLLSINGCRKKIETNNVKLYPIQNDSIISKTYHKNGMIENIFYDKNRKKNELTFVSYNTEGQVVEKQLRKDSLIVTKGDSCKCILLSISYFSNGNIKEVGCQGEFNGTGIPVGTWSTFDSVGKIKESTFYHPDEYGKDYKIIKKFNQNNKLISEKIYNNDIQYETELKELKKVPEGLIEKKNERL